eukprot:XP_014029343.1 PREDICTED: S-formylglutathione hydrolase isoform X1 [Salmo salar]
MALTQVATRRLRMGSVLSCTGSQVVVTLRVKSWDFGTGAGFYVHATQEPWKSNYRMYAYITEVVCGSHDNSIYYCESPDTAVPDTTLPRSLNSLIRSTLTSPLTQRRCLFLATPWGGARSPEEPWKRRMMSRCWQRPTPALSWINQGSDD